MKMLKGGHLRTTLAKHENVCLTAVNPDLQEAADASIDPMYWTAD